jgi:YebC/PmpR family DNA-binding regulatory protein
MSGHNKWSKIAGKKGVADQKRSNEFSKIIKTIIVAAKEGADPDTNFKLRLAVDKARSVNMPKDNIERAIARGSGTSGEAVIEEVIYEGFGPEGSAILVEAQTDNRNRTSSDMKHLFSHHGGSLGGPNSVKWMFENRGVIEIKNDQFTDKDSLVMELLDLGATDVEDDEESIIVYTNFENFPKLKKALDEKNIKTESAEMEWVAKDSTAVSDAAKEIISKLCEAFEENDDVSNYFTNVS